MLKPCLCLLAVLAVVLWGRDASAHFLWLLTEPAAAPVKVKVFFAEAAEPDDPALLDRVGGAELWAVGRRGKAQPLTLAKAGGALEAELPAEVQGSSLVLRHTYGVISRGGEPFLLKYYAKADPSPLPGTWSAVNDRDRLPLEIVPRVEGPDMVFSVRWQGQPAADATLTVAGPGIEAKREGTTDQSGTYRCPLPEAGLYSVRARLVEPVEGTHDGQPYQSVRHHSTLTLRHLPQRLSPAAHDLPELPEPVTSFGGAIAGDALYLYGGNYGGAHEYDKEGQSGDLWKLDLKTPEAWQRLDTGPKLQGLAMVAYQGDLYRVGGFTARNREGEPQDLHSQPDFARFVPEQGSWQSLPRLPAGRSSHDAALVGDLLYVVGGWRLSGSENEPQWHDTALAVNLAERPLVWRQIASPPFQRRALALAQWQGKLYCIGGMQQRGGPTTAVAVYDPASDAWSSGPALLGNPMDGFGASAFAAGDGLHVTTLSGSIQRLAPDAGHWQYLGQLDYPRFFHRLLPWHHRLVVVGGANMSVGKIEPLELLEVQ